MRKGLREVVQVKSWGEIVGALSTHQKDRSIEKRHQWIMTSASIHLHSKCTRAGGTPRCSSMENNYSTWMDDGP